MEKNMEHEMEIGGGGGGEGVIGLFRDYVGDIT